MSIPKGPPARLIPSRQLVPGTAINDLSDYTFSYQLLKAAGVAQVDAAPVDAANVEVASGSANNAGIVLPAAYPGNAINVLNNSLNTTVVYGGGTDTVQNAGTTYTASVTMATLVSATFFCIKAGFWQRVISG